MVLGGNQSGKGAKGLLMGKGAAVPVVDDKKDKKKPTSRSSRAGLQVRGGVLGPFALLVWRGGVWWLDSPVSWHCLLGLGRSGVVRGEGQGRGDVAWSAVNVGGKVGMSYVLGCGGATCSTGDVGTCIVAWVGVVWDD